MDLQQIQYREAIVTFIDILGFRTLLASLSANEVFDILSVFHAQYKKNSLSNHESEFGKSYNTDVHFFSDSAVRIKYTDFEDTLFNTASDEIISLAVIQFELIKRNILVRGGCVKGMVYSNPTSNILFGPALIEASELEKKALYPRIIMSDNVYHDYMADMSTSTHWIKKDGWANRGAYYMDVADVKYNSEGWKIDAITYGLNDHITREKQYFINCFWGNIHSTILMIQSKRLTNDAKSYLADTLMKQIDICLSSFTYFDEIILNEDSDERVKIKQIWARFQIHETIKDVFEWIYGFEISRLLEQDLINKLKEKADTFFSRYS